VTTREGDVRVEDGAVILGDVSGRDVEIHEDAEVDGVIRATGEMRLGSSADRDPE